MIGPLTGLRFVEFAGIGPGPHAAMLLADLGADGIRIERPTDSSPSGEVLQRGRRVVRLDLKDASSVESARLLCRQADVLIEGFRPGVMERLGLGPDTLHQDNPGLVYGRMTGWGQQGPLSPTAGHDLAYIARTGILHALGKDASAPPAPPLNLVGDFGGGSLYLALGILAALHERTATGRGQVIDAAIVDGTSSLAAMQWGMRATGRWSDERAHNLLDGSTPFYDVYTCKEDTYLAVAAVENEFFVHLLAELEIDYAAADQWDRDRWPQLRAALATRLADRPADQWAKLLEHTDACAAPVNDWLAARDDVQLAARSTLVEAHGVLQPRPAPRFSGHGLLDPPASARSATPISEVLDAWGTQS